MNAPSDDARSVDAVLAAAREGPPPVEVHGSGPVAEQLRAQLGLAGELLSERPGTVVETSGELAGVERAMQRVEDLGTVVLAGPPVGPDEAIDLYANLHVRGLTLIGVGPDRETKRGQS